ncbi:hypothetical protein M427DRAFT_32193 [Gonapodya prolifera JEL478]|uniref:Uncharacterized protein n=1 Tax=Gonapodya prolifera (strain JEL478) TaxID=1344416 RepID=A0A139AGC9_GONPJ|nr:hypothetical protein M427DRAFT_32193 [Gonapodya prolifera JEL478]|eukprot:KXS15495.1 hypothetical protein M427DRAFT_32193 [Gonapodya prolifera JEL478]
MADPTTTTTLAAPLSLSSDAFKKAVGILESEEAFPTWQEHVEIELEARGFLGLLDSKEKRPEGEEAARDWDRRNRLLKAALWAVFPPHLQQSLLSSKSTAAENWSAAKQQFGAKLIGQYAALMERLVGTKLEGSVADLEQSLSTIFRKLQDANPTKALTTSEKVYHLLRAMRKDYPAFTESWYNRRDDVTFEEVVNAAKSAEMGKEADYAQNAQAFNVQGRGNGCYKSWAQGNQL